MTWIKLAIHPEHDKVLRLAHSTESNADTAFAAAVRWFRWVDAHAEDADIGITFEGFRRVALWSDDRLAQAMLHPSVDWLERGRDGMLHPTRIDSHFGRGAKRRDAHSKQVALNRAHKCAHAERTESAPEQSSQPEKRRDKSVCQSAGARAEFLAGCQGGYTTPRAILTALGLREPLLGKTLALEGLTAEEIASASASVRLDGTVGNVAVTTAHRLFASRNVPVPASGRRATLGKAVQAGLADLERTVRARRGEA